MNDFDKDLIRGDVGEELWAQYLLMNNKTALYYFNDDERFDICYFELGTNIIIYYEVKTDYFTESTKGNLFIEFDRNNGVNSGINTTIADYYVYYFMFSKQFWIISVEELKNIIDEYNGLQIGTTKTSRGYLIPIESCDDILNRFQIIQL